MSRHIIKIDDNGEGARAEQLNLSNLASAAVELLAEYPVHQREKMCSKLMGMIDAGLEDIEKAELQQIEQSIDAMATKYGPLVTWQAAGGWIELELPLALVEQVNADHDDAMQTLTILLSPQLDRIPPAMMADALADQYLGKRSDYLALVALACRELK
ncbi:hypothetical protein LG277_08885 [Vreelandella aquamarina]|uniref:hypothetical protein n=1 Tax=Vreelandella aquamarina TaxID=77097 RepID=UPI001195A298|nr:hypothetical protein [Halomonas sp.]TVM04804.1 MAG: hypothetical protein FMJ08_11295 [Halomonas sp.]